MKTCHCWCSPLATGGSGPWFGACRGRGGCHRCSNWHTPQMQPRVAYRPRAMQWNISQSFLQVTDLEHDRLIDLHIMVSTSWTNSLKAIIYQTRKGAHNVREYTTDFHSHMEEKICLWVNGICGYRGKLCMDLEGTKQNIEVGGYAGIVLRGGNDTVHCRLVQWTTCATN